MSLQIRMRSSCCAGTWLEGVPMVAQLAREESDQAAATFFGHVTDWDFLRFLLLP